MKPAIWGLGFLATYIIWKNITQISTLNNKSDTLKISKLEHFQRKKYFCPNPNYVEFNSFGCHDGTNYRTCRYTLKNNFQPKLKLCKTPINNVYSRKFYRNSQYFNLITDTFYYLVSNQNAHISNFPNLKYRFIELLGKVIRYSCNILEISGVEKSECLQIKPVGTKLINAIRNGSIEKYRIHNLFKNVQIIAESDGGRSRSINIWKRDMIKLIQLAKQFQLYE